MNKTMNSAMNLIAAMMEGGIAHTLVIEGTDTLLVKDLCTYEYKGNIRIRFNFSNNGEIKAKLYNGATFIDSFNMPDVEACMSFLGEFISIVK